MLNKFTNVLKFGEGKKQKKYDEIVRMVNSLEPDISSLTNARLAAKTFEFKDRYNKDNNIDNLLVEAFAVVREVAKRTINMRHFDVQIVGGVVLFEGKIAEMKTGEGKTLVATLPVFLNSITGKSAHVVTVNDYLAKRDSQWMGPVYNLLGVRVGLLQHGMTTAERGIAYETTELYKKFSQIVPRLTKDEDYEIDEKAKTAAVTEEGVAKVEKITGIENLYDPRNYLHIHALNQSLRAYNLFKKDVDDMITDGEVLILDEFTGRLMIGRRYSEGLHQAIEAKEHVKIKEENQTLATITIQNYFRMYEKLAGMTGTALTEAAEFRHIYKLDTFVIPTNMPMIREDVSDFIYKTEDSKFNAVVEDIISRYEKGQPVLVGTISIEKSERLSGMLKRRGIVHQVLNARYH